MTSATLWYESDERIFAAHHQPAMLIDMLRSRDICSHKILRGTGLFYEDLLAGQVLISENQGLALVANAGKLSNEPEISFRWGSSWWPGHYGAPSALLGNAGCLRDALDALSNHRVQLSPWAVPHIQTDDRYCYVYWLTLSEASASPFLIEAAMSALASYSRWMSGERSPWRFGFAYSRPTYDEQYTVNLGDQLAFDLGVNVMFIERQWIDKPWSRGSETARQAAWRESLLLTDRAKVSLAEHVYQLLLRHVQEPVSLPDVADMLAMSSATLKRKLGKQGCRFQQLQDQARLQMSLYLLHVRGWNNEQVAAHLNFNDSTNFRRAFKRWVGVTPSDARSRVSLFEPLIG
ncbi:AraC family transcriptional regulator [Oceanobacter mangrovi]|uniref:AraC family transcriptional regulator n=1 Tax=Oceanobacter mangrovi TaxID=2862510 RepID=UPI001C8DEA03|nr:AraC family transcriptional regulator [Oceanobacter mangrovi]